MLSIRNASIQHSLPGAPKASAGLGVFVHLLESTLLLPTLGIHDAPY